MGEFSNSDISVSSRYIELLRNFQMNASQIVLSMIGFFSSFSKFLTFCMRVSYLAGETSLRMPSIMPTTTILTADLKVRSNSNSGYSLF
jgi:hypothetical protein